MSQTNKAILFEQFNSECVDRKLDLILTGESDKDHEKVKEMLTVRSYQEFLDKFSPKYYECTSLRIDPTTGKEYPMFTYTLEKPVRGSAEERDITLQPFYKAIVKIYENKGSSGLDDFKFAFKETLDKLYDPEQTMNEVRSIRQELQYHHNEYLKLEAADAPVEDINYHAEKLNNLKKTVRNEYLSQSQFNMLPILIQDTREQIQIKNGGNKTSKDGICLESIPIKQITFNENGSPVYHIETSSLSDTTKAQLECKSNVLLLESANSIADDSSTNPNNGSTRELLDKTFESAAKKGQNHLVIPGDPASTGFMKNMFLSVFTGQEMSNEDTSLEVLESNLEIYELMYKAAQENFAKGVVKLVEKLINIKAFFDNAGGNTELIVSNCTLETLLNDKNVDKFSTFIRAEGENYTSERIWFSIIPGIWDNDICKEDGVSKKISIDDDDEDDDNPNTTNTTSYTLFNTATRALKLLGESNIISFFNFKGCDATSSARLNAETVKKLKNKLENVHPQSKKYAVICYPNFTILPKRNTKVTIGDSSIILPPVYIDASYVACGLYCASQNMNILKSKGFKVNTSLEQPVRFNFEGKFLTTYGTNEISQLNHVFCSNMNREKILPWSKNLMDEINSDGGFGLCFCGNEMHYTYAGQNSKQNNAYILRARTLKKDKVLDENGAETGEERYRPIFKTMNETYIKKVSLNMSKDRLKELCKLWCEGTSKMNINNVIYSIDSAGLVKSELIELTPDGITIAYDRDRDDFEVTFTEL